jgi:hypothetical protein
MVCNGYDAPIGKRRYLIKNLSLTDSAEQLAYVLLGIIGNNTPDLGSVVEQFTECAAGPHDVARETVHFEVNSIADNKSGRRIEHHQAL